MKVPTKLSDFMASLSLTVRNPPNAFNSPSLATGMETASTLTLSLPRSENGLISRIAEKLKKPLRQHKQHVHFLKALHYYDTANLSYCEESSVSNQQPSLPNISSSPLQQTNTELQSSQLLTHTPTVHPAMYSILSGQYPLPQEFRARYSSFEGYLGYGAYGFVLLCSRQNLHKAFTQHSNLSFTRDSKTLIAPQIESRSSINQPVAVKFILKSLLTNSSSFAHDPSSGPLPMEIFVLKNTSHPNIIRYIEHFEDEVFFILVTEVHGTPWIRKNSKVKKRMNSSTKIPGHPFCKTSTNLSSSELEQSSSQLSEMRMSTRSHSTLSFRTLETENDILISPIVESMPYKQFPPTDLFECIEANSVLPKFAQKKIFKQLCNVILFLHKLGIVHRDIKDENILVDHDFTIYIGDFGSAAFIPDSYDDYFTSFKGTLHFGAPEVLRGEPYRGPQADVWSLGCILYALMFGVNPFNSQKEIQSGHIDIPHTRDRVGLQLLGQMLHLNPLKRIGLSKVLAHRWFKE